MNGDIMQVNMTATRQKILLLAMLNLTNDAIEGSKSYMSNGIVSLCAHVVFKDKPGKTLMGSWYIGFITQNMIANMIKQNHCSMLKQLNQQLILHFHIN